jgi:hypothetical protein
VIDAIVLVTQYLELLTETFSNIKPIRTSKGNWGRQLVVLETKPYGSFRSSSTVTALKLILRIYEHTILVSPRDCVHDRGASFRVYE